MVRVFFNGHIVQRLHFFFYTTIFPFQEIGSFLTVSVYSKSSSGALTSFVITVSFYVNDLLRDYAKYVYSNAKTKSKISKSMQFFF